MTMKNEQAAPLPAVDPIVLARLTGRLGDRETISKLCESLGEVLQEFLPDIFMSELGFEVAVSYAGFETGRYGQLVGGLYGVRIGRAFFGESMFHRERDASKVALAHLVARLRLGNFALLDAQFITEHLWQFGAVEIERARYQRILSDAVQGETKFERTPMTGAACVAILSGGN